MWPFKYNLLGRTAVFHVVLFLLYVVLSFESVDKILWCNHLNATSYSVASTLTWYYSFCMYMYTAISRKVVGKNCACDNPERQYGIWSTHFSWHSKLSNLLLLLSFSTRKHTSMASCAILTNFFEKPWTQNHPQYLSGLLCALFPTTFLEIAIVYNHVHVVLSFESVDKILRCDLSNASPQVVILRGAICFSAFYM